MKKNIILILSSLSLVLGICCFGFYAYETKKYDNDIKKFQQELNEDDNLTDNHSSTETLNFYNDSLKQQNSDYIATLVFGDTQQPIMQTKDNSFYLKKNHKKQKSYYGSIFLDYRNDQNFTDFNSIIYGHNMTSDRGFGKIKKFYNQKQNSDTPLYIYTKNKKYEANLVCYTDTYSLTNNETQLVLSTVLEKDNNKTQFVNLLNNKSKYKIQNSISTDDKFLTLYTCAYNHKNNKVLMIFKLIER